MSERLARAGLARVSRV